jgi:hypothetical protein
VRWDITSDVTYMYSTADVHVSHAGQLMLRCNSSRSTRLHNKLISSGKDCWWGTVYLAETTRLYAAGTGASIVPPSNRTAKPQRYGLITLRIVHAYMCTCRFREGFLYEFDRGPMIGKWVEG